MTFLHRDLVGLGTLNFVMRIIRVRVVELLFSLAIAWIEVWVQLLGQTRIGFLDLLRRAGRFDAQHLIRILAH